MSGVPSDEDIERARKMDRLRYRNLELVQKNVIAHLLTSCPIHALYIFPEGDKFRACVFFRKDAEIATHTRTGALEDIRSRVLAELESAGRGKAEDLTVILEVDSDENVDREFGGDYNARLH